LSIFVLLSNNIDSILFYDQTAAVITSNQVRWIGLSFLFLTSRTTLPLLKYA